jgi:hypothetical protein
VLSVGVIAESSLDTICYFLVPVVFLMYPLWFIFSFFVREARPVSYFGLSRVKSAFVRASTHMHPRCGAVRTSTHGENWERVCLFCFLVDMSALLIFVFGMFPSPPCGCGSI